LATTSTALFALDFASKSSIIFFSTLFFLLKVSKSYHSTQFLNTSLLAHIFPFLFCAVFDPGLTSNPAHIFLSGYFNPICHTYFLCVTFQPTFRFCFVLTLPHLHQFVHSFTLQWLPIFILLGTSAHLSFGLCQLFMKLGTCLVKI
jgi:hypothetical protein